MDEYTRRTRAWLDDIYTGPPSGEYVPHSPVYGFDPRSQYLGTYGHLFAILTEIAAYEFDNCLEVGAGEGFLADLIRRVFGVPVAAVDLSLAASRRARDVFDLANCVGEARQLPFKSGSVDLVVSINTLEHIADIALAFSELKRVARGVVVVGMPHAARPGERESAEDGEPHAHVSVLTRAEMRRLFGPQARIRGSLSRFVRPLYAFAASDDVSDRPGYRFLRRSPVRPFYRLVRRLAASLDARRVVRHLCRIERAASRWSSQRTYESIVVCGLEGARRRAQPIPAGRILDELLR